MIIAALLVTSVDGDIIANNFDLDFLRSEMGYVQLDLERIFVALDLSLASFRLETSELTVKGAHGSSEIKEWILQLTPWIESEGWSEWIDQVQGIHVVTAEDGGNKRSMSHDSDDLMLQLSKQS
jgi:hypothetical protein